MAWKDSAKQDGCRGQGSAAKDSGKSPFPGAVSGGGVSSQMNPRRDRRQDYDGGNANKRRAGNG